MAEKITDRLSRLERLVESLVQAQIRTERRFYDNERRWRETDKRFRDTDRQIRQLSADIRSMLRSGNGRAR